MVEILSQPGNILGHCIPRHARQGARSYQMLPAQPGVGKVALLGKPVVVPAFILGLGNDLLP